MTGEELYQARAALGRAWGLGRQLSAAEMGRALRLAGHDPGQGVIDYERKPKPISGPMSVAVEMMLAGAMPPDPLEAILDRQRDANAVRGVK